MSESLVAQVPGIVAPEPAADRVPTDWKTASMRGRIQRRYRSEAFFRWSGFGAVALSVAFLAFLLVSMVLNGAGGFRRTEIRLAVPITAEAIAANDYQSSVAASAQATLGNAQLLSDSSWIAVRDHVAGNKALAGRTVTVWVPAASNIDLVAKGKSPTGNVADEKAAYARLKQQGLVRTVLNVPFLTKADSSDPAMVGIWGAFKGSLLTMLVTLVLSFPVGVLSALYLEEYAPKNKWTDMIEVSINNLAAVPSIIFGLLGLAVFLGFLGMPRSAPVVGGLTLALMTMPVIVIAGRNAIKSVPPSIRDAALGIGASPVQVVFHHVLPLALPGILTGTIIGMARALGETAPLLMIGMRAFISAPPTGLTQPATVLPVQIYLWSGEVSRGFVEKTSAGIIVLLLFLVLMNGFAVFLRNKFERRW